MIENRFASTGELHVGDEVWAFARGSFRRARIVTVPRIPFETPVTVGYFVRSGSLRIQKVPLSRLRRNMRSRALPPPSMDQIRGAL
jgi:hypothetical protein